MNITVKAGNMLREASDLGVLATFEDAALPGETAGLLEPEDFRGRAGQTALLYPRGAVAPRRLLLVGLKRALRDVDSFALALQFERSGRVEALVHVQQPR